jgi:hypothetical protein
MNHFTNKKGYNGVRATPIWRFKAHQPPGNHPYGAYFTTLPPGTPRLATRLGIPKEKLEYVFTFDDVGDLRPLEGDRGEWIMWSPRDYDVVRERQVYSGEAVSP